MATLTEADWDARFNAILLNGNVEREEEDILDLMGNWAFPVSRIWTLVEAEGNNFLIAGYHKVNAFGYIVTEQPWRDGDLQDEWALES